MGAFRLSPAATIEDVLQTLPNPEEYVRIVVSHMTQCNKLHGNVAVRIGVMGKGVMPCHQVIYIDAQGKEALFQAYDGERLYPDTKLGAGTWSQASMSYAQVRALLVRMRSVRR